MMSMPEPQREETLQIIYHRVAFEISNAPEKFAGLFQIDGRIVTTFGQNALGNVFAKILQGWK